MDSSAATNEPPRVGLRELRHDARTWVERAKAGERVYVTDRGRVIAEIVPHRSTESILDRMIADGRAIPAKRPFRGFGLPTGPVSTRGTDALKEMREDRI
ncbi:MAG: type II toxin-antitoxin system Phd/YefM family antitoxin [Thermoleophilia bacterium]|nr:type II toxin-antitoxin system Phd/YefM family antitoxin [Thermoleophilia bacterium]